ncbi:ABC transporter substrate-binding protein [Halalkalibacter kiskunsagensis]|uniref:ABC transporter substrate-binding protein n=1 Tax=Halalkalibacter kiskunsagensis TaxID=1548599 RepID=A0ABV6KAP1_9BACI
MTKLENHYFTLYSKWGPKTANVYIQELAAEFCCTDRHAKTLIKNMQNNEWISWQPNPGRGKVSTLTFLVDPHELEKQNVKSMIENGDIENAFKWMENQKELDSSIVKSLEDHFQWTPNHIHEEGLDVLRYPYYHPIHTFVPLEMSTNYEKHLGEQIFNRLLRYDNKTNSFIPEIAHDWASFEDGLVWRFYLRKGVYFHDGSLLTSEVIKENIEFWREYPLDGWKVCIFDEIEKIETPSPTVIELYLSKPTPLLLHLFTDYKSMIIPVSTFKKNPDSFRNHPIGNGPYKVNKHEKGYIILESFSNYFGYQPLLDKIELFHIPTSPVSRKKEVKYRIAKHYSNSIKQYKWVQPELGGIYLVVNHQREGIHTHPKFKKMLSYSLDRPKLFQGHPHHDVSFPDSFFDETTNDLRQQSKIKKAKKWLQKKGVTTLTLSFICFEHENDFGFELERLTKYFRQLGITLNTTIVTIHDLAAMKQHLKQTDLIISGMNLTENHLVSMLNALSSSTSIIRNTLSYDVKRHLDFMLADVRHAESTEIAYQQMRQVESFLFDHYYVIFLYQRKINITIEADDKLEGIELNHYNQLNYQKLWYKLGKSND